MPHINHPTAITRDKIWSNVMCKHMAKFQTFFPHIKYKNYINYFLQCTLFSALCEIITSLIYRD